MSGTTPRTGERPVGPAGMAALLAAARAARAVSTPPTQEESAADADADTARDEPPHTAAAA